MTPLEMTMTIIRELKISQLNEQMTKWPRQVKSLFPALITKSLFEIKEYLAEESSLKEMGASQIEEKVVVSIRCHRESEGGVAA